MLPLSNSTSRSLPMASQLASPAAASAWPRRTTSTSGSRNRSTQASPPGGSVMAATAMSSWPLRNSASKAVEGASRQAISSSRSPAWRNSLAAAITRALADGITPTRTKARPRCTVLSMSRSATSKVLTRKSVRASTSAPTGVSSRRCVERVSSSAPSSFPSA